MSKQNKNSAKKANNTSKEVLSIEDFFNERKEALKQIEDYVIKAAQNLEQRPEEIRRELMRELKITNRHNQQLLAQIQQLSQKFDSDRKILFAEIDYLKRSLQEQKTVSTSRKYL